jgi:hypothetical protein
MLTTIACFDADEELRDPAYWSPTEKSGLYETAEQAEQDACNGVHWLRQLNSNLPQFVRTEAR